MMSCFRIEGIIFRHLVISGGLSIAFELHVRDILVGAVAGVTIAARVAVYAASPSNAAVGERPVSSSIMPPTM